MLQEIPPEQRNTYNWMSIWRVLYRTLFYVAPKIFSPSLRGKSISLENFERPQIPKDRFLSRSLGNSRSSLCAIMDTSPSLSSSSFDESSSDSLESPTSYSSFERGINYIDEESNKPGTSRNRRRCITDMSYSRFQKDKTNTHQYGSKFNNIAKSNPKMRKRSQSLSNTATKSFGSSDSDEVDLDIHLSTPYSEQWNKKHYRTSERLMYPQINDFAEAISQSDDNNIKSIRTRRFEAKSDNKESVVNKAISRLTIPTVASIATSDDDDITPEVKYVGMLVNGNMFRNM